MIMIETVLRNVEVTLAISWPASPLLWNKSTLAMTR